MRTCEGRERGVWSLPNHLVSVVGYGQTLRRVVPSLKWSECPAMGRGRDNLQDVNIKPLSSTCRYVLLPRKKTANSAKFFFANYIRLNYRHRYLWLMSYDIIIWGLRTFAQHCSKIPIRLKMVPERLFSVVSKNWSH